MDNLDYCRIRNRSEWEQRGKERTTVLGSAACGEAALLVVLKFFVPGHLNRFELAFVR
jgi:hypothetical protein